MDSNLFPFHCHIPTAKWLTNPFTDKPKQSRVSQKGSVLVVETVQRSIPVLLEYPLQKTKFRLCLRAQSDKPWSLFSPTYRRLQLLFAENYRMLKGFIQDAVTYSFHVALGFLNKGGICKIVLNADKNPDHNKRTC